MKSARRAKGARGYGLDLLLAAYIASGLVLGVAVAKWGNVVILDELVQVPRDFWEFVYSPWPLQWGYAAAALALLICFATNARGLVDCSTQGKYEGGPGCSIFAQLLQLLPFCWLFWALISALMSPYQHLVAKVVPHLVVSVGWYAAGMWALRSLDEPNPGWYFWLLILVGMVWCIAYAFQQHFGGLDRVLQQLQSEANNVSVRPEFIERLLKKRVFGTLFYPNSLAGVILLLGPPVGYVVWDWSLIRWGRAAALVLEVIWTICCVLCLLWTKSKAGWLIGGGLVCLVFMYQPVFGRWRWAIVGLVAFIFLTVLFVRFSAYFHGGASSVGARLVYWRAAIDIAIEHPIFGTGPGSFKPEYDKRRPPGSEPTRLVHNDFLEQAVDSGLPAAIFYLCSWVGILWRARPKAGQLGLRYWVWISLIAYVAHSLVEFHLYIPALAWPAFLLLGWISKPEPSS